MANTHSEARRYFFDFSKLDLILQKHHTQKSKAELNKEMEVIDKLAWIEIVGKKVLCARSRGKDIFYIPGGKREHGETDHQALVREIEEELSVHLDDATLNYVGTFQAQAHGKPVGVEVKMQCYSGAYEGDILPYSEIEEIAWLNTNDMDIIAPVDKIIFNWLKEHQQID
ncbi:MAG: NUDIX domain-containing protein [Bacteroidota bacterium]